MFLIHENNLYKNQYLNFLILGVIYTQLIDLNIFYIFITPVLTLMDLLDECEHPKLQQQTQAICNHIDDIGVCYQQVEEICFELAKTLSAETLNFVGLAWQHDHQSHQHKGEQKKYHLAECKFWLEVAMPLLGKHAQQQIDQAFELFNGMVRTSSLVEMVNSQIRPYLNSCKGQITQEHLNLIMFYHNHHLYKSGKRKGKAPLELLIGIPLEGDWLDRLLQIQFKANNKNFLG